MNRRDEIGAPRPEQPPTDYAKPLVERPRLRTALKEHEADLKAMRKEKTQ